MRVDLYTKIVLTTIACCLVWLCVRDVAFITPAHAQMHSQSVFIAGVAQNVALPVQPALGTTFPVNIASIGRGYTNAGHPLNWQPLPVVSVTPTPTPSPTPTPRPTP